MITSLQSVRPLARPAFALALLAATLVSGCAVRSMFTDATPQPDQAPSGITQTVEQEKLFGILPIYRPDIQQGNFVSREMVEQLKIGMTREQVRFVLGTPLLIDAFHPDRWDYPFRLKRGDGQVTSSHLIVYFKDDRLERFEGGDLPEENDYLKRLATPKK